MDIHGSTEALDWIRKEGREYQIVIVGGDLVRLGDREFASKFLKSALSTGRRVFYVPGNAEPADLDVPTDVVNLHGRTAAIGGYAVGGLGGSNPTPFHTPFELADEAARAVLSRIGPVDILVSHCPPSDTLCDTAGERHIGSVPVREYVTEHSPRLVLCGHAHESRAKDRLGRTDVVNPGPLLEGNFAELDLDGEIRVELKSGAW